MILLTDILNSATPPDPRDADQPLPLVYDELRKRAAQRLAHEPTALVHEADLRSVSAPPGSTPPAWNSRGHFFAATAAALRRILIEMAQVEKANDIRGSVFRDLDSAAEEKEGKSLRVVLGERLDKAVEQLDAEAIGDPLAVARM